jgi:hypothetical protein
MDGDSGNDVYFVNGLGDLITEQPGAGQDMVFSAVSYVLPAGIETLRLTGGAGSEDLSAFGAQPQDAVGSDHIRATANCVLYLKADRTLQRSRAMMSGLATDTRKPGWRLAGRSSGLNHARCSFSQFKSSGSNSFST